MKRLSCILSLVWLVGALGVLAQAPADSNIKAALADIEKFERQFAGSSANPNSVRRTLKLLRLTRQRLDGSANQTHPSWAVANERYNALITRLNGLLDPATTPPPPPAPAVAQAAQQTAPAAAPQQMISQYRVRIKKIARDIESRIDSMNTGGVKPFQDPGYVAKFEKSGENFRTALEKYNAYRGDPDVEAAVQKLGEFYNMIAFGKKHAAETLAELGDVQAQLAQIGQTRAVLKLPDMPQGDYQPGELVDWVNTLAAIRQGAVKAYEPIPAIKEKAYLPNTPATLSQGAAYDFNDLLSLERSLTGTVQSVDEAVRKFNQHIDHQMELLEAGLSRFQNYDPADRNDQTNHFLGEGRADEIRGRLHKNLRTAQEAAAYAQRLNHDNVAERETLVDTVQSAIDQYEANFRKALELVRMPDAASKDKALEKIAREALAGYDYVGEIKRLVINTEKVRRSEETSEQKFDDIDVSLSGTVTMSGTRTSYFYEWEQFQVATAEPVGDKYYIFYNTLKYFTRGATRTPLNHWVVSGRLQGSEIPEANIQK